MNAAVTDPVTEIQGLGGLDVAVVLAASPAVLEQAHASLRRGGRLVLVSLPKTTTAMMRSIATVTGKTPTATNQTPPIYRPAMPEPTFVVEPDGTVVTAHPTGGEGVHQSDENGDPQPLEEE